MRANFILLLILFTAIAISTPAYAYGPFTVSGNVSDANGIPLPHAYVNLNGPPVVYFQNETHSVYISGAITDANGHFVCQVNETSESQFSVTVDFISPTEKRDHFLYTALYNITGQDIVIPDKDTQFTDYVLPGKGYIRGLIIRESDHMLMTGTVYLSNGKTCKVTDPLQLYLFEVGPGNYSVYAIHEENGEKLMSDKVEVQALPAERKENVLPIDLWLKPVDVGQPTSTVNTWALALAFGLGLACILALAYGLRRLV